MGPPVDLIAVSAAFSDSHEKPSPDEIGHDLLSRPLADADPSRDLADPDRWFASDAKKHVSVVREDEPGRTLARLVDWWLLNHGS
jgi:hypothetical protein